MDFRVEEIRLHCKLFHFERAFTLLNLIPFEYSAFENKSDWIVMVQAGLRVYSELDCHTQLSRLQSLVKDQFMLFPTETDILYAFARVCFEEGQLDLALTHFKRAYLNAKTVKQTTQAILGEAILEFFAGNYEAVQNILLDSTLSDADQEFQVARYIWLSQVKFAKKSHEEALAYLERAKTLARQDRNIYLLIQALLVEIEIWMLNCNYEKSQSILNEITDYMAPELKCRTNEKTAKLRTSLQGLSKKDGFELVESESRSTLRCQDKRVVDLTGVRQIVVLLKILGNNKGQVITKEEICHALWKREYHPLEIDNKIYVVIRRLRRILGDNLRAPHYILTKEDGYCFNPECRFTLFQHKYFAGQNELS